MIADILDDRVTIPLDFCTDRSFEIYRRSEMWAADNRENTARGGKRCRKMGCRDDRRRRDMAPDTVGAMTVGVDFRRGQATPESVEAAAERANCLD